MKERFFLCSDEFLRLRLFIKRRKLLKGTDLGFRATTSSAARNFPTATIFRDRGGRVQRLTYSKPVEAGFWKGPINVLYWLQAPSRHSIGKLNLSTLPPDHKKCSQ